MLGAIGKDGGPPRKKTVVGKMLDSMGISKAKNPFVRQKVAKVRQHFEWERASHTPALTTVVSPPRPQDLHALEYVEEEKAKAAQEANHDVTRVTTTKGAIWGVMVFP